MSRAGCRIMSPERWRTARGAATPPDVTLEPRVRAWLDTQLVIVEDWLAQLIAANGDERLVGLLYQHAVFLRDAAGD